MVRTFSTALVFLAGATLAWAGPDHIEDGDAGSLPDDAQRTVGNEQLQFISGSLGGLNFNGMDLEDVYIIVIDQPGSFIATTSFMGGSTQFDSRLYLMDITGLGLLGNDNGGGGGGQGETGFVGACCLPDGMCVDETTPFGCSKMGGEYQGDFTSCGDLTCPVDPGGSTLGNASSDGTEVIIDEPGEYLLAITVAPREPLSNSGPMYFFENDTEVSGPDGPGGGGPIVAWMEESTLECGDPEAGSCFESHSNPFCDDFFCCEAVCKSLPFCCEVAWDTSCVSTAFDLCGKGASSPGGGPMAGDYIIALIGTGFADPEGACCLGDGSCQETSPDNCAVLGGNYQGDASVCTNPDGSSVCECPERTLIIKQGACPAPINANSNGVVPMALIGEADFAVQDVVASSLELRRCDGKGGVAVPLDNTVQTKDVNHPFDGKVGCNGCACNDNQNSDGISDLAMKFRTSDVVSNLALSSTDGVVVLELTGVLEDGSSFCARDCVVIMPPGDVTPANAAIDSNLRDVMINVAPLDLNVDSDGFTSFGRSYFPGTPMTITAPAAVNGHNFVRWSIDGVYQPPGLRTLTVPVCDDMDIYAIYGFRPVLDPASEAGG